MSDKNEGADKRKPHRARNSGVKADKKKLKNKKENPTDKQKNPKAFAINSAKRAERQYRRKEDLTAKKQHIPVVDKTPTEPPPILIAVVGPPKVGKTTLINNLIKSFTKTNVSVIKGPITMVTSKKQRITLIECNNDVNCMIDVAKCADLVLLMCDASFGFEMEIFEFLNICQVHGMPKIMGVLTHLDMIKNSKALKTRKKELKHRFWTEVYSGAKLFYLSGILHGEYLRNEIKNLGRFISVIKYRPLSWRGAHSYLLADRMEDITNLEEVRLNSKCDRSVVLYGYIRGVAMNKDAMVHIAGFGDIRISELNALPDPCPLPTAEKKRNLLEKERLLYAPMSGVGSIVYDKDAVYIELQGSHHHKNQIEQDPEKEGLFQAFIDKKETIDIQVENQEFKLFSDGNVIKSSEFQEDDEEDSDESDEDEEEKDSGLDDDESDNETGTAGWNGDSDNEKHSDEEDDGSSDEEYDEVKGEESSDENVSKDDVASSMSWKEGLAKRARDAFLERKSNSRNLMKIVYGVFKEKRHTVVEQDIDNEETDEDAEGDTLGGLFKVASKEQQQIQKERAIKDQEESCFFEQYGDEERDWLLEDNKSLIWNCFVTGKWKKSEDAEELLKLDDLEDDTEVFGDFEDLETGEKHKAIEETAKPATTEEVDKDEENSRKRKATRIEEDNLTRKELVAKKAKLKAKFDAEYDDPEKSERITGDHQYYEQLKAEAQKQSDINKTEFSNLDEQTRLEIEGYRAGMYVRMNFKNVACEFADNFDPTYPILVGGLNMSEENVGFVSCKVKKHRWYKKILKTSDPLIISLGWRRFQTMPIYSKIEDNLKMRYLKYTPNHVTCCMTFYGPITPQNTGFLAIQSVAHDNAELKQLGFRIAATGCVIEMDKSTQIMKKLKLVGTPYKIYQKTAMIKGMFNSELEVAKFESAKIKTVSGIRGTIKKAERTPRGAFRATFEDKILLSDIVFCRTWFRVDVPEFYTPVTSLLLPESEKSKWIGMKTVGQLKREKNIKNQPIADSLYKSIVRENKEFRPLTIPKSLQKALPYKDKQKHPSLDAPKPMDRVLVVLSPHEQKVAKMMKMIKTNFEHKQEKQKAIHAQQLDKFRKVKEGEELRKLKRIKELKKKVFRTISKMDKAKPGK